MSGAGQGSATNRLKHLVIGGIVAAIAIGSLAGPVEASHVGWCY
jgi:hypothetical protein